MYWSFERSTSNGEVAVVLHIDGKMEQLPYGTITSIELGSGCSDVVINLQSKDTGLILDIDYFLEHEEEFSKLRLASDSQTFIDIFNQMTQKTVTPVKEADISKDSSDTSMHTCSKDTVQIQNGENTGRHVSAFLQTVKMIRNSLYQFHKIPKIQDPPKHSRAWLKNEMPDLLKTLPSAKDKKSVPKWTYYCHLKVAELGNDVFKLIEELDTAYGRGNVRGQGKKREMKSGLFQNLKGVINEDQLKVEMLALLNRENCIDEFKENILKCRVVDQQNVEEMEKKLESAEAKLKEQEQYIQILEAKIEYLESKQDDVKPDLAVSPPLRQSSTARNSNIETLIETGQAKSQTEKRQATKRKGDQLCKKPPAKRPWLGKHTEETVKTVMTEEKVQEGDWVVTVYDELCVGKVVKINRSTSLVHFLETTGFAPSKLGRNDKQRVKEKYIICKVDVFSVGEGLFQIKEGSWVQAQKHGESFIENHL
ncbi:uncharacterized protein [Ptychodera flava]|uniref:uncharacterized protein n=1 Tax=Ptychodera flava TaxID=63121 RepID=UPI00396A4D04